RNLPQTTKIMAAIQQQWKETLGIRINLQPRDYKSHMAALFVGNYEIGDVTWCSKVEDPLYVLSFFLDRQAKINLPNWDCPKYRQLLQRARVETASETRRDLIKQAEAILLEEMPLIPLYFPEGIWLQKPHLDKVTVSRLKEIDFKEACFSSP
ncbi:MAG: peptide ABC transporter substrate-binding protein, partial [Chlamydiota bacterium]